VGRGAWRASLPPFRPKAWGFGKCREKGGGYGFTWATSLLEFYWSTHVSFGERGSSFRVSP